MKEFEILCVTMNQQDFAKIKEMNIHSDVVFANQYNRTDYSEYIFEDHLAKMITTNTRGVGVNRNIAFQYASAEICLLADDDVRYDDNAEKIILDEFRKYPKADIIIFHLETDDLTRPQKSYKRTRKTYSWERMPWAGFRIAFKLPAIRKANLWFTTLFGGGCIFPSGEDSLWLLDARKKKLNFYVSNKTIGRVSFSNSTWFTGYNEKYYYGKGAFYEAIHHSAKLLWYLSFVLRTRKMKSTISLREKIKWMRFGADGFNRLLSFDDYLFYIKSDKHN